MRFRDKNGQWRTKISVCSEIPDGNVLCGEVIRIVYESDDMSYGVVRIRDFKNREYVAVGSMPGIGEGQIVELNGTWEKHPDHGLQLRVTDCNLSLPVTVEGITRYLSSGILPGIGQKTAQKIVEHFGVETISILDKEPRRLLEISGFTRKKVETIREAWAENTDRRDLRIHLEGLGISPAYFARIYKCYGDDTARKVQDNPYNLARDIRGIGFLLADRIAMKAGIQKNDLKRLTAGVSYVLEQSRMTGNVCMPRGMLLPEIAKTLSVSDEDAVRALEAAEITGQVASDTAIDGTRMYYEPMFLRCENELPYLLRRLLTHPSPAGKVLARIQPLKDSVFSDEQLTAVNAVSMAAVSIITGGPGVGKTTVVSEIVRRAKITGLKVVLAAPTGRASKRLSESTGMVASTIHRLLKWDPVRGSFVHTKDNPLDSDLFVIDESSMLDLPLSVALFRAVPNGASVVIVGDPDQLPSIGPGNILNDLINSGICPVSRLTKIFRQGNGSGIVFSAHAVNQGRMPAVPKPKPGQFSDFYWIQKDDPTEVADVIKRLISDRIPKRFGFHPVKDVQLLCPMNKGEDGTAEMNKTLQSLLNPQTGNSFTEGQRTFALHDKVMQTANNYDKGVFNGDMGFITRIDTDFRTFQVDYDGMIVDYSFEDADQIVLAYAVTVHKSQGSEYPVVVMPILSHHYMMLQRNLLYTGMTRAKKLMILVGSPRAVSMAVRNAVQEPRNSLLLPKLQAMVKK